MKPYFEQAGIAVYHGDARELLGGGIDVSDVGCVVADPPYGETSLDWDRWPMGWPMVIAERVPESASLWCFGSMRMFLRQNREFDDWRFAQDIVWEKHNGSSFHADRFKRVHEVATQWYRGEWESVFKYPQFTNDATARQVRRKRRPPHMGEISEAGSHYVSEDGGPRLMRSVLRVPSVHGDADVFNETQKPLGILEPLIRYSLAPGRVLLDPFCGAGSALVVAKMLGARAIGVDIRESQCEATAKRLIQTMAFAAQPPGAPAEEALSAPPPEAPSARAENIRREPPAVVSGAGPDAAARVADTSPKRMTVHWPDGRVTNP